MSLSLSSLSDADFFAAYDDVVDYYESVKIVRGREAASREVGSLLRVYEAEIARRNAPSCCLGGATTGNHSALCPR